MNIKDFNAGTYQQQIGYRSFQPAGINHEWAWSEPTIDTLLEQAVFKLGGLNAFSLYIPDVNIFIRMHVVKEATSSSRIEGTRTNIDEAIMDEKDIQPVKRDDWQEVNNYINALNYAVDRLAKLPLSSRLIRDTHRVLMSGVHGKNKHPGEFRKSQNWIGGATPADAIFVPPVHASVPDLITDLESFLHNDNIAVPNMIRIAIAHYQFETIHPFLDGNGRVGRLLIPLYLIGEGILAKPVLYLSSYFEKHRSLYYDNLRFVTESNRMIQWIKFFLVAITETAKTGIQTLQSVLALKERLDGQTILRLDRKVPRAKQLLSYLYTKPSVMGAEVAKVLGVTPLTANGLIDDFISLGILREVTGGKRNRIYTFDEYLSLFR
ncbi:MAG: Fic family protein [Candidatus Marinimicrobia bacterium]|nr:Fic family protein [bacterium]MCG2715376.1 Fic family protein [Candidatus Neomarinimicrobiota bacterium]